MYVKMFICMYCGCGYFEWLHGTLRGLLNLIWVYELPYGSSRGAPAVVIFLFVCFACWILGLVLWVIYQTSACCTIEFCLQQCCLDLWMYYLFPDNWNQTSCSYWPVHYWHAGFCWVSRGSQFKWFWETVQGNSITVKFYYFSSLSPPLPNL